MFRCTRILLAAVMVSVLAAGCSITKASYADRQVESYLKALTRQTPYPLARNMTWKYLYSTGTGKHEQRWLLADGEFVRGARDASKIEWYAAKPASAGTALSESFAARAEDASRRGDHQTAQVNYGASEAVLATQIATERTAAAMGLGQAIQGLGSALVDAMVSGHGEGAAEYIRSPERGVIGEAAPDGSILELFFSAVRLDGKEALFQGGTNMRWETLVTLQQADGKIWKSAASFTTYQVLGDEEIARTSTLFEKGEYVPLVPGTLIPLHNRDYVPEENEMRKIWARSGAAELGMTAMQAIADLYSQIETAQAR